MITAITTRAFLEGNPKVKRLFPDVKAAEQAYYKCTDVFPIMHAVAIRRDAIAGNPSLPKAVFEMYSKAKEFENTRALMGNNFWPYGIEANRKDLDLVMRYTHEQGLVKHRMDFQELFDPSTLELRENS